VTRRRYWTLALALGLGLALVLAEAGLRMSGQFEPPPQVLKPLRPEFNRPDPELGYTLKPLLRTTFRYPPTSTRDLDLVSNRDGFRNSREFDEPDSRPRLWVLGDSLTSGEGVNAADRITEVIERLEPGWRVDNLAMTSWGLDSMVRAYERLSHRLRPSAVLLNFYTDDFRRLRPYYAGMGYPFVKFELEGGRLVDVPFPDPPGFFGRLRVVQAVEQSYWRFARNRYELNKALLDRLRERTEPGTRLAAAFLPGTGDTQEDKTRRGFLRDWCQQTGTPYFDLTDTMHGAGNDAVFIPGNPHWNERGHELAGRTLHQFLKDAQVLR